MMKEYQRFFAGFLGGTVFANLLVFRILFPKPKKKPKKESYDCAVVCGYPANADGTISGTLACRVQKGVKLWKAGTVKYLLLSGGAVANRFPEAEIMKEYAQKAGVPNACILTETQSVSTYHNMMYARQLMKKHGLKDCIVVTSGWHLRKANHYAQKFGLDYVMCACGTPKREGKLQTVRNYITVYLQTGYAFYKGLY